LHQLPGDCSVVWWDPSVLNLGAEPSLGIRKPELIVKDVAPAIVESGLQTYNAWRSQREKVCNEGVVPSVRPTPVVKYVPGDRGERRDRGERGGEARVEVIELPRAEARPSGRRFGSLVHAVLASVPLDAGDDVIEQLARNRGRILGSEPEELYAATHAVRSVLAHPLVARAHDAAQRNRCRREAPITFLGSDGALVEGVVDLAFEDGDSWTVVDFKTDEQMRGQQVKYEQQLRIYAAAIAQSTGRSASMVLMKL
jgi:ATP-dependent exoDNAse (exonuclease V) beta subunit